MKEQLEEVLEIPEIHESGAASVPDFNTVIVTQTYEDYDPWIFKFRRQLNEDLKKLKQEFYSLVQAEQNEKQHEMRVIMLGSLLREAPTGIPGYLDTGDVPADFVRYFEDIINWVWSVYQRKLYPKEVIATPFE
jgi:hypothetical protein